MDGRSTKIGKYVFLTAGIYGLIVMAPMYFLESKIGEDYPPAITHPEYFYGFISVTVAFQILFLIIGTDPVRFRPVMLAAIPEKLLYVVAIAILYSQQRVAPMSLTFAGIDLIFGVLFTVVYVRTPIQSTRINEQ